MDYSRKYIRSPAFINCGEIHYLRIVNMGTMQVPIQFITFDDDGKVKDT
jgi:hypothetical protein